MTSLKPGTLGVFLGYIYYLIMSINQEVQSLSPSAVIELFELDNTPNNGEIIRFHAGTNELKQHVIWGGQSYAAFPIEAKGFELLGGKTQPRPTIKVANINQLISVLLRDHDDLLGLKVTRIKTLAKYLDATNFPNGINPDADPAQKFADEIFFIERKTSENKIFIEFELASAVDVQGMKIPKRQVIQGMCQWTYRSPECGYAGSPVADENDRPVNLSTDDKCGKRLSSCKLRFGTGTLPFGGFPGVNF